jgi:hypothetical protein
MWKLVAILTFHRFLAVSIFCEMSTWWLVPIFMVHVYYLCVKHDPVESKTSLYWCSHVHKPITNI